MADTLADMKARIARELSRADLTTQIAAAISDAISIYQKERFRFNESVPSAPVTFNTVASQSVYGVLANANIGTLYHIDYMLLTIGNSRYYMSVDDAKRLKIYNQVNTMFGQPLWYAYEGNELILSPVPSNAWSIEIGLFRNLAAPATDAEAANPWMMAINAERLIRSRAKYEIAVHVTRNPTMAAAMSPFPPAPGQAAGATYDAWRSLKGETNRVTGRGRVRAMKF